jgi:hypothetical protein
MNAGPANVLPLGPSESNKGRWIRNRFNWYWLADLCAKEGIAFVLGHALYVCAIHGANVTRTPSCPQNARHNLRTPPHFAMRRQVHAVVEPKPLRGQPHPVT